MMFAFAALVAMRMGGKGASLVLFMIAIQGITGAYLEVGFFAHDISRADLHNYWAYMLIISLISMVTSIYLHEIKKTLSALELKNSALNAAANAIVITDLNGQIEWANRAFTQLTGFSREEAYGRNPRELVRSGEHERTFYQAMWQTILSKQVWRGELVNRRKDGTLYHEDMTITPVVNDSQDISHFVAVKQDISERIRAAADLLESEERFRFMLESSPIAVRIASLSSGQVTFANQRYLELIHSTAEQVSGLNTQQYYANADDYAQVIEQLNRGSYVSNKLIELNIPGSPATRKWVLASYWKMKFQHEAAVLGWFYDISDRKREEQYEQFRSRILEMLAGEHSLNKILYALVVGVEEIHPAMICSILLLDADGRHLSHGVAPHLPDFYNAAINGVEIGVGVGSCGTAAFTGERVVVEDITVHPYWADYKGLAEAAGLGACWSQPILGANGKVLGTFAIYHHEKHTPSESDVATIEQSARLASIAIERKRSEEMLRLSEMSLRTVSQGVFISNAQQNAIFVNQAFFDMTGYGEEDVMGKNCRFLQGPLTDPHVVDQMRVALKNETEFFGEVLNYRKDGTPFWNELTITPVRDSEGRLTHFIGVSRDISKRKESEEQISSLAFYDPLTLLPNRRLLNDRIALVMAASKRNGRYAALMVLDLDNFKPLNDAHGHMVGDLLLVKAAERLKNCVRETDTVARFGGDEFVVLLSELYADKAESISMASAVAEKIRASLSDAYFLSLHPEEEGDFLEHCCSASIGVAVFVNHEDSQEAVFKRADAAMYQAKESGRNRICLL